MSCGAETVAKTLLAELIEGKSFAFPDVDLDGPEYQLPVDGVDIPVTALTNEALTTRQVNGDGTFDALMESVGAHLKGEFNSNRISGAEYAKAYIALVTAAMSSATQFLLGKDQAYWQAVLAKAQAKTAEIQLVTARVGLETAKAQMVLARYQAITAEAEYGLTTMKIASEDQNYCNLIKQTELLEKQITLVQEQTEVQRAQTLDTRTDGITTITGSVGKQKELYNQQITSYQRDAEVKAGKLFVDAWITQKTIDEGLVAPNGFTNASVDDVLTKIKTENGFA